MDVGSGVNPLHLLVFFGCWGKKAYRFLLSMRNLELDFAVVIIHPLKNLSPSPSAPRTTKEALEKRLSSFVLKQKWSDVRF